MNLPAIPHALQVEAVRDPPQVILHVKASIPEGPASEFAEERRQLLMALAAVTGPRMEFDAYKVHWAN